VAEKETEMSATLARKLRRIGLQRMSKTDVVVTTDEQGKEVEATVTTYITRRRFMSEDELRDARQEITTMWREKRKRNKMAA
jgi:hypothetical protein